jgi:hypothetical protein
VGNAQRLLDLEPALPFNLAAHLSSDRGRILSSYGDETADD